MDKTINQTVQLTFDQAIKHHKENDLNEAKNLYLKVIEIDRNHEDAHNNLGIIFSNSGDLEKAKSCFEKVLTINPKNFNAYNNIGNIFKELGDIENAIAYAAKMAELEDYQVKYYGQKLSPEELLIKELLENFDISITEPKVLSALSGIANLYESLVEIKQPKALFTCQDCMVSFD